MRLKRHGASKGKLSGLMGRRKPLVFIAAFALVGASLILLTRAAGPFVALEPENATLAGSATKVTDATASGGSYLKFGEVGTTPETGARPTRDNTGPRYSMTTMTADQFVSSKVCNRQRINGDVNLDESARGQTFTMTDCEINGNLFIMTGNPSSALSLAQLPTFNMDYVDIIRSIQANSGVKYNVNHTFIGNQPQFTVSVAWAQLSGPSPSTFSNTLFYQPFAYCVADQYEPCPQAHSEAIHVLGFPDGLKFYNVSFELEGGPFIFSTDPPTYANHGGYTGIMNFHAQNSLFDGCWFYAGNQVATFTIGFIDGPGNVVKNSAFDDRLRMSDPPDPNPQRATYINNRSIQTGQPYSAY